MGRLNGWVDGRWSQSATTCSSGVTAVSKLGDPHRPFREHGQELEPAAQRGDVVGQGAHVHVRPVLEARYVRLVDLQAAPRALPASVHTPRALRAAAARPAIPASATDCGHGAPAGIPAVALRSSGHSRTAFQVSRCLSNRSSARATDLRYQRFDPPLSSPSSRTAARRGSNAYNTRSGRRGPVPRA